MADLPGTLGLLFGNDETPGLVGCAPTGTGMRLWWRRDREVTAEEVGFAPFFLLSHRELLDAFKPDCRIEELNGENLYRFRVTCENWSHHDAAVSHINAIYRQHKSDFLSEPVIRFTDPVNHYLLATGRTHYKDMALNGLKILYLALRAVPGDDADYPDPMEPADRIIAASLASGNGDVEILDLGGMDEKKAVETLADEIALRDPDIIVGHDIFKGTLNYIAQRAKRHRAKLNLGRDGSVMKVRKSRAPAAEKQLEYPRADIAGRSVVDTWFLAQYYDIVKRDLEQYDAPYVARYLDQTCQLPDPVPAWDLSRLYGEKRAVVLADLKYEIEAVRIIFRTLCGSYFAQSQMLPLSLQDCVVRGNGVKINNLLMREYLHRGESIPIPAEGRAFIGGHTEIRETGLIRNVLNVDVASLYPSIMLSRGVKPGQDTGDVFQPMLRELTSQRLAAKKLARTADDESVRVQADAKQAAFKIFINSFFGYLGTNRMNWADPAQAELITTTGQEIVKELAARVEEQGGAVIEIDTDGVYFRAPEGCDSEAGRDALVDRINAGLPEGIVVELGGYYPAMLSHKVKNYALLSEDGSITVKGSGMKSRGLEPYLHQFIADGIRSILIGRPGEIEERHGKVKKSIEDHSIDISRLAKTDTLIESLDTYTDKIEAGKRNRAAAYEIALQSRRPLRPGDQVSYYIVGEKATVKAFEAAKPLRQFNPAEPDYNVKYYVKKLDQNLKKVMGFVEREEEPGLFG